MKYVLVIIFIILLLFLQTGIFPHLAILGVFPNLILLSILGLSIIQGWKKTLPWIIVGGLFLDFYSLNNFLGLSIIGLLIVSYLICFLGQRFFKEKNFLSLILVFTISIIVYSLILIILYKIFSISFDFMFLGFLFSIFYNLFFAIPIFYLFKKYVN